MNTLPDLLSFVVTTLQAWPVCRAVRVMETARFSAHQFAILLAVYPQRRDWWGAGQSWLSGLLQQLEISFPADSGCGQVRADMRYGHVPYFRQVRPLAD